MIDLIEYFWECRNTKLNIFDVSSWGEGGRVEKHNEPNKQTNILIILHIAVKIEH